MDDSSEKLFCIYFNLPIQYECVYVYIYCIYIYILHVMATRYSMGGSLQEDMCLMFMKGVSSVSSEFIDSERSSGKSSFQFPCIILLFLKSRVKKERLVKAQPVTSITCISHK